MKKTLAIILSTAFILGCTLSTTYDYTPGVSAEDTAPAATSDKDPDRLKYQELLTKGRSRILEEYSIFVYFQDMVRFDITDVNNDGKEELVVLDKNHSKVHVADTEKNSLINDRSVKEENYSDSDSLISGGVSNTSIFYSNGTCVVPEKPVMGLSKSFSPFSIYKYDKDANKYLYVGTVEAWEKDAAPTNKDGVPYPEETDKSSTGTVYFIDDADHDKTVPVDKSEYDNWKVKYYGGASALNFNYKDLTEQNIANIDLTPRTPQPVVTTAAETKPVTTVTTESTTTPVQTTTEAPKQSQSAVVTFENQEYDLDSNETLNTADLIKLIQIIINPEKYKTSMFHGDINKDGNVNSEDLIQLKTMLK